ncbi:MAG: precorrin-3B C(17)-methyltransferase [Pseudomonadota bacterium]
MAAAIRFARAALARHGIDPRAVAVIASLDKKSDEPALHAVAEALGAPFRVFDAAALAAQEPHLTRPSEIVRAAVGVAGVAEAAALAAAGDDGRLIVPKEVNGQLTLAIAEAATPILPLPGRSRGHLAIVGIGPGTPAWRTAETVALLARADAFVGYCLYLDLVEDLRAEKPRHDFALGDEAARTRFALELAGEGRTVALISSGDAGIYAMASLAAELLDTGEISDAARRVDLTVAPGVSAAQAAAARVGAPLGHDFAFISLSDLLTPWPAIVRRLSAAAEADFVVALYNPRSRRRTTQLEEAKAIFAAARPPETPVVIAASLGRPAEAITHTTIGAFDPAAVDMLATVIIGASTTRRFTRGDGRVIVYTPRGYEVVP